ncbi:MAG: DUF1674 domain-containing protein [Holosporales bacterium]
MRIHEKRKPELEKNVTAEPAIVDPADEETGGDGNKKPTRLDPTRYLDWEKNGRAVDF